MKLSEKHTLPRDPNKLLVELKIRMKLSEKRTVPMDPNNWVVGVQIRMKLNLKNVSYIGNLIND